MNFLNTIKLGGCTHLATKRIFTKTAVYSLNISRTTVQVWSTLLATLIVMEMSSPIVCTPIDISRRSHNRHGNAVRHHFEWINPCGGSYIQPSSSISRGSSEISSKSVSTSSRKHAYKLLRKSIRANNQSMWERGHSSAIITSDISEWFKHNQTYSFLAQIRPNSNITLMSWHRDVQVYVAAFQFLHRKQDNFEQKVNNRGNHISKELRTLLNSAKLLLCEIETAINQTSSRLPKILTLKDMKRRITFRTKNVRDMDETEVDHIDLKFSKARFYEYLYGLNKTLNKWLKRHKKGSSHGRRNSSNSNQSNNDSNTSNGSFASWERRNRHKFGINRYKVRNSER